MSKLRWLVAGVQFAAAACVLSMVVGCGGEAAGTDPGARAQTQADAKSAMEAASKHQKSDAKAKRSARRAR